MGIKAHDSSFQLSGYPLLPLQTSPAFRYQYQTQIGDTLLWSQAKLSGPLVAAIATLTAFNAAAAGSGQIYLTINHRI